MSAFVDVTDPSVPVGWARKKRAGKSKAPPVTDAEAERMAAEAAKLEALNAEFAEELGTDTPPEKTKGDETPKTPKTPKQLKLKAGEAPSDEDASLYAAMADLEQEEAGAAEEALPAGAEKQGRFLLMRQWGVYAGKRRGPGVYLVGLSQEGKPVAKWLCSRLELLAHTRDSANRNWGTLLEIVDKDRKSHVWAMPAEIGPMVGDGTEFRRSLVNRGWTAAPGTKNRNAVCDYITTWRPSRKVRCVQTVGWCGDAFVMPDETFGGAEETVLQVEGVAPEFATAGTLDSWRTNIAALCVGNSRLVLGASAAFAGPLLKLVGEESGGIHFLGASSIGKTTALHAARSVWGTPLGSWRTTDNGAEGTAAGANDTLLTLDEIGQASPRVVSELAYMLGNGRGKGRMKRDATARAAARWRVPFLSTGELSMSARMAVGGERAQAGQEVRILEIAADAGKGLGAFEDIHGFSDGAAFAEHFRFAADKNCGHAAREFLTHITKDAAALAAAVADARKAFIAENVPDGADGQVRRACGRFAIIAVAGELATQAGITGWQPGEATAAAVRCWQDWLAGRGGTGAAETREGFAQVRLFLEQHGEARFAPAWAHVVTHINPDGDSFETAKPDRPVINRAGFRKEAENGEGWTYYVLPEVWRREVCKGLDAKAVAVAMAESGWIERGDGRNLTQRPRIPGEGHQRVYVVTPAFLSADT